MFDRFVQFVRDTFGETDGFIPLHEPRFTGNEKAYVNDAIDSTFVSSVGRYVDRFEEQIREYTGAPYAIATVNGTAALHIALVLAGVERDDLVLTQPLSFVATSNAIAYTGAEPCFIDIDLNTLSLSPEKLSAFLDSQTEIRNGSCYHIASGKRVSACVPMHTFGHPARIEAIVQICTTHHIAVVEDAAESLGSTYQGKQTGTFGLLGTYSFNGNKTITCGGGGMVVTNDEQLGKLGKHLTTQAKVPHKWEFNHDQTGYNYRLPNLNAAMACAQMEQLDGFIANKQQLAGFYQAFFQTTPYQFIQQPADSQSNFWLNAVLLNDRQERDEFLAYTNSKGIMTRPAWTLLTKLPMLSHCLHDDSTNAQYIEDRLVNIPSSVRLT
ncbi:LegC family aminotransferase [Spirosoma utsteinense]|uniref:Aminotransferase in exopolysaccharide biosynthesis n=1 Tax=Spirosoma utsteinense TaxID=2585773 RepID=A0ABR6WAN6_9BACT|nr:LegC family aminotransferase [Spirosoma utsteinense]MBC3787284.1 aminotransferase in exopolysaccharide biosynthesis [Spirosoma utsteinense]MBC3792970.1 aminotransferase in exopolysaccharide biosynthesis [Spirosoma utsteinense]